MAKIAPSETVGVPLLLVRRYFCLPLAILLVACNPGDGTTGPRTPNAPSMVSVVAGEGFVDVTWMHDGQDLAGFLVSRTAVPSQASAAGDAWQTIAELAEGDREYRDETVEAGVGYRYLVAAVGGTGDASQPAGPLDDSPVVPLPAPDPEPEPDPDPGIDVPTPPEDPGPPPPPHGSAIRGHVEHYFTIFGEPSGQDHGLDPTSLSSLTPAEIVPGSVVVQFRSSPLAHAEELAQSIYVLGFTPVEASRVLGSTYVELRFEGADETRTRTLVRELAARDDVLTAEPVYVNTAFATGPDQFPYPNDPMFDRQYALWTIDAEAAWRYIGADLQALHDVTVAIIDTGMPANGHLDISPLSGWNMIANSYDVTQSKGTFHGLHVAGIAGAKVDNQTGIAGVAPNADIIVVKVLADDGKGNSLYTSRAIAWAAGAQVPGVPTNQHPARVLNLSLGGRHPCTPSEQSAINQARALGAVVVVAAGNEGADAREFAPANCAGVVVVGATDSLGNIALYSNDGAVTSIMAPGSSILSYTGPASYPESLPVGRMSGTSMAAPHVAGAYALAFGQDPSLTADQATEFLLRGATPMSDAQCRGQATRCGAGLLNLYNLVQQVRLPIDRETWNTIWVVAFPCLDQDCTIDPFDFWATSLEPGEWGGDYVIAGLPNGTYRLAAILDYNGNLAMDEGEPCNEHTGLVVVNNEDVSGVDLGIGYTLPECTFSNWGFVRTF